MLLKMFYVVFYLLGARYDNRALPRLRGISAVSFLSYPLQEMEEIF